MCSFGYSVDAEVKAAIANTTHGEDLTILESVVQKE